MKKNKNMKIRLKKRTILIPIILILSILGINLANGNIQQITGIGEDKTLTDSTLVASNGNIGGNTSNNKENNILNSYQIMYFLGLEEGCSEEDIDNVKNAGFTVAMLSCGNSGNSTTLTNTINRFKDKGVNVIIADARFQWVLSQKFNSDSTEYNESYGRELMNQMVEYYKEFDNVVAYHVADEPGITNTEYKKLDAIKKIIEYMNKIDPQRPCFVNMLPSPFTEVERQEYENVGITNMDTYFNQIVTSKSPYLSTDPYPQYLKRTGTNLEYNASLYYSDLGRLANFNYNYRQVYG